MVVKLDLVENRSEFDVVGGRNHTRGRHRLGCSKARANQAINHERARGGN